MRDNHAPTNVGTGRPGHGILFVAPVDRAIKVRKGEEGLGVLQ